MRVEGIGEVPGLDYRYNTQEEPQKLAEAYQAAWTAVGVDVELSDFEFGTYEDKVYTQGAVQLFRGGWGADYPSMDSFLHRLLQGERSTADERRHLEIYAEAERLILKDAPVVPVAFIVA